MVLSTVVMLREGSFALASFGRVRKVQEPTFAVAAGRKSFALKRTLEAVWVIFAWNIGMCFLNAARFIRSTRGYGNGFVSIRDPVLPPPPQLTPYIGVRSLSPALL